MTASKTFALAVVPFLLLLANSARAFAPVQQPHVGKNEPFSGPSAVSSSTQLHLTMLANAVVELQEVVTPLTLAISATALSYQMDKDPEKIPTMFFKKTQGGTKTVEPQVESSEEDVKTEVEATATVEEEETTSNIIEEVEVEKTSVRKRLASVGKVISAPGRFVVNRIRRRNTSSD